ncbi:MAG: Fic family protein [Ruminococcus sp.]|nr:Fic family protein [Ruminococcus sp.]
MDSLNPYNVDDLLYAHSVMLRGLVDEAGYFRQKPVGVVDSNGKIIHFGTLPDYIPKLVNELLEWVKQSDLHILIKSCVFHYEFELIHPFLDGNGRMGRLWHTLLLSKWNSFFAWIPIESVIHNRQSEYYTAINISNHNADSTAFIEFMLETIKTALLELNNNGKVNTSNRTADRKREIVDHLTQYKCISNKDVRELLSVSSSTANRLLSSMVDEGFIIKIRNGKTWAYKLSKEGDK